MAFDERLGDRIRDLLDEEKGVSERKMFGGLAFMVDGNMSVGIVGDELMVRVGPDAWEKSLAEDHVRVMDFTGKPMRGYVYVDPTGIKTKPKLRKWVTRGVAFARTLPKKKKKAAKKKPRPRKKTATRR